MPTALITGITGQDGAYLAKFLLGKGYGVVGTSRYVKRSNLYRLEYLGIAEKVQIVESALDSKEAVDQIIKTHQPDEVYNLTAQSSVGYSFENPIGAFENNLLSVTHLLNSIKSNEKKVRFYQASSSEMFGNINQLPVKEDAYFHPSSPYGISKAAAHWLTINYREGYDMFAACGILFNHESCLRGENYVIKKIVNGALRISNGDLKELHLGNLEVVRDWGYAPKYVEAMWLILQQDVPVDYLVCSNTSISLKDLAVKIFEQVGLDFEACVKTDDTLFRVVDLSKMWGDNTKAKEELNWVYDMSIDELVTQLLKDESEFMEWQKQQ